MNFSLDQIIQTAGGLELPGIVFFNPLLPEFLARMEQYRSRIIVDVGAGVGRMAHVLMDAHFRVLPIDINYRAETEVPVYEFNATTFDYPEASVPVIARPCHGPWIQLAIIHAMETVPLVLYVGLRKNFGSDLFGMRRKFKVAIEDAIVGKDGERIVRIEHR